MLRRFLAVELTADGVRRARNGQDVEPGFGIGDSGFVRLLDPAGELVGIAEPTGVAGLLHPFVVLG
jgi:hypothetical protein